MKDFFLTAADLGPDNEGIRTVGSRGKKKKRLEYGETSGWYGIDIACWFGHRLYFSHC